MGIPFDMRDESFRKFQLDILIETLSSVRLLIGIITPILAERNSTTTDEELAKLNAKKTEIREHLSVQYSVLYSDIHLPPSAEHP